MTLLILEKALFRKEKKTLAEVQSLKTSVEVRGGEGQEVHVCQMLEAMTWTARLTCQGSEKNK